MSTLSILFIHLTPLQPQEVSSSPAILIFTCWILKPPDCFHVTKYLSVRPASGPQAVFYPHIMALIWFEVVLGFHGWDWSYLVAQITGDCGGTHCLLWKIELHFLCPNILTATDGMRYNNCTAWHIIYQHLPLLSYFHGCVFELATILYSVICLLIAREAGRFCPLLLCNLCSAQIL